MSDTKRLGWVDAAKGISILLVVVMYSAYSVGEDTGGIGFLHYIIAFATPFRMPEFFLISGLFLSLVIGRDWPRYGDRRVLHYLYFYVLWMVIHITVKVAIFAGNPVGALSEMAYSLVQPYGVLWFIYVLAMFSATAKLAHDLRIPRWAVWCGGAALQIAPITTGAYAIDQYCAYFVFFYTGYITAPLIFSFVESGLKQPMVAAAYLILWAAINAWLVFSPDFSFHPDHFEMGYAALPGVHLLLAVAGAVALCILAALLVKLPFMRWLSWLGARSLIVYVAFALPMSMVELVGLKFGFDDPNWLSLAVFLSAVAGPLVLEQIVVRTGLGSFLFVRPAWAHLPGTPGSRNPPVKVSAVPAE